MGLEFPNAEASSLSLSTACQSRYRTFSYVFNTMSICIPPWFPTWWQWTTALNFTKAPKFQKTCWVPDCLPRGHWRTMGPTYYPISCPTFPLKIDQYPQRAHDLWVPYSGSQLCKPLRCHENTRHHRQYMVPCILTPHSVYPTALKYTPFPGHNIKHHNFGRTSLLSQRQCKFLGYQRYCWFPKSQMSFSPRNPSKDTLLDMTSGW